MTCTEFRDWLQQGLDGTANQASFEGEAHAEACAHCRSWQDASNDMDVGLHLLPAPVPESGLSARIVALVIADQRRRRRQRRLAAVGFALAAGLLCLAVGVMLRPFGGGGSSETSPAGMNAAASHGSGSTNRDATQTAATTPARLLHDLIMLGLFPGSPGSAGKDNTIVSAVVKLAQALDRGAGDRNRPNMREEIVDASDAVAHQLRATADHGRTLIDLVTPMPSDSDGSQPMPDPTRPLADAGQHVETGFKPVTGSARRAVDLFLREVPAAR
jgi:hypothetical protein